MNDKWIQLGEQVILILRKKMFIKNQCSITLLLYDQYSLGDSRFSQSSLS